MVAGPQAERTIISSFFAAYNDGAEDEAKRFAVVSGVWDPVAAPYSGVLRPDLGEWIRAGHEVQDEIEIVELCVYPGRGADGQLIRRNDVLANAGMVSLQQGFKVQVNAGVIERLVLYMPDGQAKQRFCSNFGDAMRQVQTGRNSQC